jgi:hypothetical protein
LDCRRVHRRTEWMVAGPDFQGLDGETKPVQTRLSAPTRFV